eukprot:1158480-Pelagomonas_calceolata.AAC.12
MNGQWIDIPFRELLSSNSLHLLSNIGSALDGETGKLTWGRLGSLDDQSLTFLVLLYLCQAWKVWVVMAV